MRIVGEKLYNSQEIGILDAADREELLKNKGSGFGLMNCKGIIEKYRKTNEVFRVCLFNVESTLGKGSRFYFRLPTGVRKTLMVFLCIFFSIGMSSCNKAVEEAVMQPDEIYAQTAQDSLSLAAENEFEALLNEASDYANDAYYSNVEGNFEQALEYVDSAMSGTTNTLVEISDYLYKKNPEGANEIINKLESKYRQHIDELFATPEYKQKGLELIKSHFDYIRSYTKDLFTLFEEKVVLAQGELISTAMMNYYLQECGVKSVLLPALEYMRTDKNAEPDPVYIKDKLQVQLELHPDAEIYITQGYICRNAYGEIDNLQRGGSDYTASLIGAAINASEIQIWTDIDGMHNNDPRIVDKTAPVRHLHFEEAAELAYFGAKILHPTCIQPAKYANIPVRLLNTMDPTAPGTLISNDTEKGKIKAVAAKDNITAIKIKSSRMLLAHGFLRKVFEIFESYQTSIDMICTSEVGVSVSIDNVKHLNEILDDLKKYGTVTVDKDMCIICVVGDLEWENVGFEAKALDAMRDIPVRMISFGGSNYNISFLIRECDKKAALQSLSDALFNEE